MRTSSVTYRTLLVQLAVQTPCYTTGTLSQTYSRKAPDGLPFPPLRRQGRRVVRARHQPGHRRAFAASIQCPPDPGAVLVPVSGSAPSYNLAALNSTQELLQLNFGAYTVNQAQAPANSTGFYVTITGITIVGSDGATLPFTFTQSAGGSPVINGSGGAISVAGDCDVWPPIHRLLRRLGPAPRQVPPGHDAGELLRHVPGLARPDEQRHLLGRLDRVVHFQRNFEQLAGWPDQRQPLRHLPRRPAAPPAARVTCIIACESSPAHLARPS
jgi:hypothetical protein